jgi:hypothetical protein
MEYRENSTALSSPSRANGKWSAEVDGQCQVPQIAVAVLCISGRSKAHTEMDGLYSTALMYFLISCVCILPGILAAAFGRGGFMVAAAGLSAWTLYAGSPFGIAVRAWSSPTRPLWYTPTVVFVLAAICACLAIIAKHRKG